MMGGMPKAIKMLLPVICVALLLSVLCKLTPECAFVKIFLGYAEGLDHKVVVLAAPIVKMISALALGIVLTALIIALAFGKSWARKTCIVMAMVRLASAGLAAVSAAFLFCFTLHLQNTPCRNLLLQNLDCLRWWNWADVAIELLAAIFVVSLLLMHDAEVWYRADATAENKWKNRLQCLVFWVLLIVVSGVGGVVQSVATGMDKKVPTKFPRLRVAELNARADLGDVPSMWRLGNWEKNGWLGEKHPDKAFAWYKKAADRGDRSAINDLGDCFEKGIGTETNLDEAVACWMKAAEKKHGWAACKVAIRYQKDKKQSEAFEWFRKSADIGNDYGCCKLGECYEKGWGTETNAILAAKWFLTGARRRHGWGMEKAGDFYRDGYGVEKDIDKAREWYEKAVKRGNKNAQKKLDALKKEEQSR